ncbi:MAG: PhzF family phenazine biosynthesis protein [Pseudomonadota bacterium]
MTPPTPRYFDCFTTQPGGGNPVALLTGTSDLTQTQMQGLAREIGAPATCFWCVSDDDHVRARFFSPRTEYKMCGHAVIGLFTLVSQECVEPLSPVWRLSTPSGTTRVYVESESEGSPRIMLDFALPRFSPLSPVSTGLAEVLKIPLELISGGIPVQTAHADFRHVMVNITSPEALAGLVPSFDEIAGFCKATGLDSIAVYAFEEAADGEHVWVREFCPLIGVEESAAGGTTNASLSCLLAQTGYLGVEEDQIARCIAHQGAAVGRPSLIHCEVTKSGGTITGVRAGGHAVEVQGLTAPDRVPSPDHRS